MLDRMPEARSPARLRATRTVFLLVASLYLMIAVAAILSRPGEAARMSQESAER